MIALPSNTILYATEPGELKNCAVSHYVAIIVVIHVVWHQDVNA